MKPSELPGTRTNGTLAILAGTDEQGRLVTGGGFVVPEDHLKVAHGYATTSHSSQGLTANFAVVFGASFDQKAIAQAELDAIASCARRQAKRDYRAGLSKPDGRLNKGTSYRLIWSSSSLW